MQQLKVINILKNDLNFTDQSIDKLKIFVNLVLQENKNHNLIAKSKDSNSFLCIYAYNISKYKILPDWLNSDNWANPKLWEK